MACRSAHIYSQQMKLSSRNLSTATRMHKCCDVDSTGHVAKLKSFDTWVRACS
jgi:hypothetical protein